MSCPSAEAPVSKDAQEQEQKRNDRCASTDEIEELGEELSSQDACSSWLHQQVDDELFTIKKECYLFPMEGVIGVVALEKHEASHDSQNRNCPSAVFLYLVHTHCLTWVGIRWSPSMAADAVRESKSTGREVKSGVLNE